MCKCVCMFLISSCQYSTGPICRFETEITHLSRKIPGCREGIDDKPNFTRTVSRAKASRIYNNNNDESIAKPKPSDLEF